MRSQGVPGDGDLSASLPQRGEDRLHLRRRPRAGRRALALAAARRLARGAELVAELETLGYGWVGLDDVELVDMCLFEMM